MKIVRTGLRFWLTLASFASFLAGWVLLVHAPKPGPASWQKAASAAPTDITPDTPETPAEPVSAPTTIEGMIQSILGDDSGQDSAAKKEQRRKVLQEHIGGAKN